MDDSNYILEFVNPQTNEDERLSGPLQDELSFPNAFLNPLIPLLKMYPVKQNEKTGTADIFRVELDFYSDSVDIVRIQVVDNGAPNADRVGSTNFLFLFS